MRRTMKRSLALFLSVVMMLTVVPLAFAAGDGAEEDKAYGVCNSETCGGETRELKFIGEATPATCTEDGYSSIGYACTVCGEGVKSGIIPAAKRVAATGHELEPVTATAPTCLDNGVKAHRTCTVCGKNFAIGSTAFSTDELSDADLIDEAVGSHDFQNYDPTTLEEGLDAADYLKSAATCTEKAVYYKRCTVCGEFSADEFFSLESDPEPAHVWDEGTVVEEATCADGGKDGKIVFHCLNCEKTKEEILPKPESHTAPVEGVWTYPEGVTCLTGGTVYRYCTVCGEKLEEKTVEPAQHNTTGGTVDPVEPTCTEAGHTVGLRCVVCGEYVLPMTTIPATGHSMTKVEATESTCTKNGNKEYYSCSVCEKLFLDEAGENEITLEDTVLILKAHTPVEVAEVAATCTEKGHAAGLQCEVCGALFDTEEYAALGHKIAAVTVSDATCTEDGYKIDCYRCAVCGECFEDAEGTKPIAKDDAVIPALGHDMVLDEEKSTPATCTEDGREYKVCSRNCGEVSDVVLEATDHDYSEEWTIDTPATCMAVGSKSKHCLNCGESDPESITEIGTVGHDVVTTTFPATCEEDGKIVKTCSYGCDYYEEEVIKASGRHEVDQETGKCTICGTQVCTCLCHKTEWYYQIIYFIVRVWWEFLGQKPVCECGRVHYTAARV